MQERFLVGGTEDGGDYVARNIPGFQELRVACS